MDLTDWVLNLQRAKWQITAFPRHQLKSPMKYKVESNQILFFQESGGQTNKNTTKYAKFLSGYALLFRVPGPTVGPERS